MLFGVSKIFGMDLKENFDAPYFSQNVKEFWRKWHISLSSWLRDYIYIPLGGSRCGKMRKALNVIITFLASGLWHGISYMVWGILHGILVLLGDKWNTKWKAVNQVITFLVISFTWSFFLWENNLLAFQMIGSVFTNWNIGEVVSNIFNLGLTGADWIVFVVFTIILFIFDSKKEKLVEKIKPLSIEKKLVALCSMILLVLVLGIYGIGFDANAFIYSQF